MLKLNGSALWAQLGPLTQPPAIDQVDCKLVPEPASLLQIRPAAGVELERVIVAIHSPSRGSLERALAVCNPITGAWH